MPRLLAALALLTFAAASPAADPPAGPKVKLAVVVYFDQMRGDYLDRWKHLYGDGGFKRLTTDGASFTDCHYPYAGTSTGPGHASTLTGTSGAKHGIVENDWYDRAAGVTVYCAASDRYQFVPPPPAAPAVVDTKADSAAAKPKLPGNPDRLLSPGVADSLKQATAGKGRVFGLSLKDRSAIFPAGKSKPDGVYWFDGRWVTSTYYRDSLPGWVQEFNSSGFAESFFGKNWVRFRPDLDYDTWAGPDDGPGEGTGKKQGKTFPHPTTGGLEKPGKEYYEAVATSPFGNDLLVAFAKTCIQAERLGQGDTTDLLTISFSSNDLVGHAWGPDSHEVLDITLRSDALMADLLKFLDARVGAGNYCVVMTSDHGICPIPEGSAKAGKDARRVSPKKLLLSAERFLEDTYGQPPAAGGKADRALWIEAVTPPDVYLNHRLLKAKGLDPDAVAAALAKWATTQPGVLKAYTHQQLRGPATADDPFLRAMQRSFHPDRSGDVAVVLKPYWLLDTYESGTSHGSPHPYDTHVPLVVFGPGVPGGKRTERVTPLHAAAIVADFLGVPPPRDAEYGPPQTLHQK
jgi:hypothetical protein